MPALTSRSGPWARRLRRRFIAGPPALVAPAAVLDPTPSALPNYVRQGKQLPLGVIFEPGGARLLGAALDDVALAAHFGADRARMATVQAVGIARAGAAGVVYVDRGPQGEALGAMAPYLTDHAQRVLEIDLSRVRERLAGWNPLSMEGCGASDVDAKIRTIASAFAAAFGWADRRNRTLDVVARATRALCELALQLPPELAPTVFQIATMVEDPEWRAGVVPYLEGDSRAFWASPGGHEAAGAAGCVAATLRELYGDIAAAGVLGQPRSTFSLRAALDAPMVVLFSPGRAGEAAKLVNALFLSELHEAAAARRRELPPEQRQPYHVFVDEPQLCTPGSELVSRMLLEGRGQGLRLHVMAQEPAELPTDILDQVLLRHTHLLCGRVGHDSAARLCKEWATRSDIEPATITQLGPHDLVATATVDHLVVPPFVAGDLLLEEVWADAKRPEALESLGASIDRTMSRRSVAEVLTGLERLDWRILDHLSVHGCFHCG